MKKLSVTIQVEFEVPDSWELVQHPDNIQAIKLDNGYYMDMSYAPMLTKDFSAGAQWTGECPYVFASELLNMIENEETSMKLVVESP
jgi:hypothetical protein